GVDPQIGPLPLDGPVEKGLYLLVDLFAQAGYLAFGDTRHAHGFYKIINGSGRYALDVGLLNYRRQSLLGHAARIQEAREVAAGAKLWNAQLNGARPCLPVPVAIAVALGQSEAILLAIARASLRADLQRHQLLGSEADHLPEQIGISALLNERAQVHHIFGHRWCPSGWL